MKMEGYMALCVSILRGVSPEKAFALLEGRTGHREKKKHKKKWSKTEIIIMKLVHDRGGSWDDAGKQFGISGSHARSLVMYHSANH